MSTKFEEMTNVELKEACKDFGLEVKAKNPAKPNKSEYLKALNDFKAQQDEIHKDKIEAKAKEAEAAPVESGSKRKPQTPAQLMKLELFRKERVVVRDMQEAQTKDELISVSWGNRLIGRQTDWVDLRGEPQYVRVGAINNLKEATMVVHVAKPGGGVQMERKNRFVVVPVDGLTPEELEDLAAKQKVRNSKVA